MKVLFLDHDGVICLEEQWGSRYEKHRLAKRKLSQSFTTLPVNSRFDDFDAGCIKALDEIIEMTDCEIVVSSDWRNHATLEEMGELYTNSGILKEPIDYTPFEIPTGLKFYNRYTEAEETRSYEILEWLKKHPEVTHWVAVDDMSMGLEYQSYSGIEKRSWGLTNFVRTYDDGIKNETAKWKTISYLM